jgi:hypothetical protein
MSMRVHSQARSFPPYDLLTTTVQSADARMSKLARIYHVSQEQAWDGREVLRSLIDKHGGIAVRPEHREPLGRILAILLWGELAAWSISAELAERLEDVDAKMAATSQAFDEARHFYVLRDYCLAAGIPLPRLGGLSRKLLTDLLETRDLALKLVGMQLLVETMALVLFRQIAAAGVEKVLCELLPYYERDEARHVGLGVLYLPPLLARMGRLDRARFWLFQLKVNLLSLGGGLNMREDFRALGIDQRQMNEYGFRIQREVLQRIVRSDGESAPAGARLRGFFRLSKRGQQRFLDLLHPRSSDELPPGDRRLLQGLIAVARLGNRLFD